MFDDTEKKVAKICFTGTAFIILIAFLHLGFAIDRFIIIGHSMFPTIMHGDMCFTANQFFFMNLKYERNDVIVFKKDGRDIVKRIIGLPGEHIVIKNNEIKINNKIISNGAILINTMDEVRDETLGPNEYYMLGDNRSYSLDSRHDGPIQQWQIQGKVLLRWHSWNVP